MDVILRPVSERFLDQVAFPAFEEGVLSATSGLSGLLLAIEDPVMRGQLEVMLDEAQDGGFVNLDSNTWLDVAYRLLFSEWTVGAEGWTLGRLYAGLGGDLDEILHLSLMLEDPSYPYFDGELASQARTAFLERPKVGRGVASLVAGAWDPFPSFPPSQVLVTLGRGGYNVQERLAFADWSYRPANVVKGWSTDIGRKLRMIIDREAHRLAPLEIPESNEVLDYWLGQRREPPFLSVIFSGLGTGAMSWVRVLGELSEQIRMSARAGQGLTSLVSASSATDAVLL